MSNSDKDDEKAPWEITATGHHHETQHFDTVEMADRKDSVVLQEAADLYGDIQTAESEFWTPVFIDTE